MYRKSKRVVFIVLTAMLFSVLACSTGGTTPQGEERQQSGVTPVPEAPTQRPQPTREVSQGEEVGPSQPQGVVPSAEWELEVFAGHQIDPMPWGEQGMQRLTYYIAGKNASTDWYGYSIGDDPAVSCSWMVVYHSLRPSLFTEEGYEYLALMPVDFQSDYAKSRANQLPAGLVEWYNRFSFTPTCGSTWAGSYHNPLPPGAVFVGVSRQLAPPVMFGIAVFDIPESATPELLQVPYTCMGSWRILECGVKTAVTRFDPFEGSIPIDESYGARIHRAGEKVDIGGVANLAVTGERGGGNTIQLVFTLESRHTGYTLKVNRHFFSFLHRLPTVISTFDSYWMNSVRGIEVGPMQTIQMTGVLELEGKYWPTPAGETFWLFGQIELKEDSPAGVVTTANYLVELP